jgi:hypothetical protein
VQTGPQNEVALEQSPGFTEKGEQFFPHLGSAGMLPALSGMLPDSFKPVFVGGPPAKCRRRLAECQRSPRRKCFAIARSILSGSVIGRFAVCFAIVRNGNDFDFDLGPFRQGRYLDCRSRRRLLLEIRAISLVNGLEIAEVGKEDRCFHNVLEREALGFQNSSNVIKHTPGLRGDVAGDNLAGFRVERNLAAAKQEISATYRLRVRADCRRRFARRDDFLHAADCSSKAESNNERFLDFARNDKGGVQMTNDRISSIMVAEWLRGF